MRTISICLALCAVLAVVSMRPASADEGADGLAAPPPPRHWFVGGGVVPVVWMPANEPVSVRIEGEVRWMAAAPWFVLADVSYVQVGKSGSRRSEDGIGLFAGGMRQWAIGEAETATFFPHVRAGLVFEATSTRTDVSKKHIALRAGPGIDWAVVAGARLNLDLEIGVGLLSIKAGSAGDSALAELTLGLALRLLWGF